MRVSTRIFVAFFLLLALVAYGLLTTVFDQLKPGFSRATEETLVDTSNLLAELLVDDMATLGRPSGDFREALDEYSRRRFEAQIYEQVKTRPALRVYVTDARGTVVFDSTDKDVGADYSRWNDVLRTLRGEYGARATRDDPEDEFSTVYFVAAPITQSGELLGVVSVGKPSRSLLPFLEDAESRIRIMAIMLVLVGLLLAGLFAAWISRSLRRLTHYADAVSRGETAVLPELHEPEFRQLGNAMADMRTELEGKEYVENTVHALAHELKSPLAAIRGAVELLAETPEAADRERFIRNIRIETDRLQQIAERMLQLASLERQQDLLRREQVGVAGLLRNVAASRELSLQQGGVEIAVQAPEGFEVRGDPFLLEQAIGNLVDNAIDFSEPGMTVTLEAHRQGRQVIISVVDSGSGIPEFALPKIRERFYSLQRPGTGRRSSGLGLSFVGEVARLHHGEFDIANREQGVRARLVLPA